MNAETKVRWLNALDPLHTWTVGEDNYCLHCDGVFKAEDVIKDAEGDPNCPVCRHSSPIDFFKEPWWRSDLMEQGATASEIVNTWLVEPIRAVYALAM